MTRDRLVKKFVRLALASEYTRQPIRRTDVSAKGWNISLSILSMQEEDCANWVP